ATDGVDISIVYVKPSAPNTQQIWRRGQKAILKTKKGGGGEGSIALGCGAQQHDSRGSVWPTRNCTIYDSRRDRSGSKFCYYFNGSSSELGTHFLYSATHHCNARHTL